MSEENNDDIWADDDSEGEPEEGHWENNDPFFSEEPSQSFWIDQEENMHELQYGDPTNEDAEYRQGFDSFEEAKSYINEILTGADQYFDIFYEEESETYEVYYMGGSE